MQAQKLFHHLVAHLYAKLELWISQTENRCLVILDAAGLGASINNAPQGLFTHRDFSFLILLFSRLSRIIVAVAHFQSQTELWSEKKNEISKISLIFWYIVQFYTDRLAQYLGLISH